jgi:hypothetical protein
MRSAFRHGAIVLALVGVIGLMAAHRFGSGLDATDEPLGPTFPDDETTGSIDRSTPPGWIQLSDDQRGWIFLGVMNLPDVTEARIEAPSQAAALPDTVDLFDLPEKFRCCGTTVSSSSTTVFSSCGRATAGWSWKFRATGSCRSRCRTSLTLTPADAERGKQAGGERVSAGRCAAPGPRTSSTGQDSRR